jgi:hypothetical protein
VDVLGRPSDPQRMRSTGPKLVDHVRIERLRAGQRVDLRLTPGEHLLSIENNTRFFCMDIVDSVKVVVVP